MKKVMRIGTIKDGNIYVKAEIKDGKLSISGVVGPKSNGDCNGGAGQIDMEFMHRNSKDNDKRTTHPIETKEIIFAAGWTAEKWLDLLDIWKRWHLNDMQAACEHQRQEWDTGKEIVMVEYMLNTDVWQQQNKIKGEAVKRLQEHGLASVTQHDQYILSLPLSFKQGLDMPLSVDMLKNYTEKRRETKTSGWVKPDEHPNGLLTKPCPICGYKYGTTWRKEELPQSVIDFIASLPDTDRQPAWV